MSTLEEIKSEMEPFINTVVMTYDFELGILHGVVDGEDDYCYDVENINSQKSWHSCVGHCIGLKGVLPDNQYNYIESSFKYQKDWIKEHAKL